MKQLLIILLLAVQGVTAQPTIDGTITTGEGYALVYQNLSPNLGFGEGNRLGGLYYAYRSDPVPTMYIGITGRINDANNIVLFLDFDNYLGRGSGTMRGNQSSSLGVYTTNATDDCGSTGGLGDARMSTNFDADYIFAFNRGGGPATIFADAMRLGAPPGIDGYMEHANINTGGLPNQTGTPHTMTLPFTALPCATPNGSITVAFRNDFDPVTQTTSGIEMALPVSGMCGVAEGDFVRFFVAITNQVGFFSNVTIPALPDGTANPGCNPNLNAFSDLFTSFYLLPFHFSNLQAKAEGDAVRLNWNLSGNADVQRIEVQHSIDGVRFSTAGVVPPALQEGAFAYSFLHQQSANGLNFYRIKAMDARGKSALSGVARITRQQQAGKPIIAPNPVTANQIRIQTGKLPRGTYQLQVLATDGRQLIRRQIVHDGVQPVWEINCMQALSPGMYWLQISGNGTVEQHQLKLLKQ